MFLRRIQIIMAILLHYLYYAFFKTPVIKTTYKTKREQLLIT